MAVAERVDPYRGFNFRLDLGSASVAGFRECSGLSFTIDPVEYREGTDVPSHSRMLTGRAKYAHLAMKRGMTKNQDLFTWFQNNVTAKKKDVRDGAVILQDEQHNEVMRWNFENGWICKWEGPMLNATSNDVAIESIEICVEQVVLA
jgi:phage tail-like protein